MIISAYTYLKRISRWLDKNKAKYNRGAGVGAREICGGGLTGVTTLHGLRIAHWTRIERTQRRKTSVISVPVH